MRARPKTSTSSIPAIDGSRAIGVGRIHSSGFVDVARYGRNRPYRSSAAKSYVAATEDTRKVHIVAAPASEACDVIQLQLRERESTPFGERKEASPFTVEVFLDRSLPLGGPVLGGLPIGH